MNGRIALLSLGLALTGGGVFASEPQAPPSPATTAAPQAGTSSKGADGKSIFVGHYGEIIQFPNSWTANAELRESTEAVYFHRKSHDDFGYKPFNPKPADYKLEEFAPKGLMELVVIPKNTPGGLHSLKEIRRAKENELKQNDAVYRTFDEASDSRWPLGTFHIAIERPYRIYQTYAESPNEFYIFTVGGRLKTGDYSLSENRVLDYRYAAIDVGDSIGKHLLFARKKTPTGFLFRFEAKTPDELLRPFKLLLRTKDTLKDRQDTELVAPGSVLNAMILPGLLVIISSALLILSLWPGKSASIKRVRLFGRSMSFYAILNGLAGFLVVYVPARFANAMWNSGEVALLIPVLFMPGVSWAAARLLGSEHTKRVLVSTGGLAVLWTILMLSDPAFNNTDHPSILAFDNTLILLIVGLVFGAVFALTFGPLTTKEASR